MELGVVRTRFPSMLVTLGSGKAVLSPHGGTVRKAVLVRAAGLQPGRYSVHMLLEETSASSILSISVVFTFQVAPNPVFCLSVSPLPVFSREGVHGVEIANFSDVQRTLAISDKGSIRYPELGILELPPRAVQVIECKDMQTDSAAHTTAPEFTLIDPESGRIYVVPSLREHIWFGGGTHS